MKLKEVDRTANVAWSPAASNAIYLAAGTAAQQLDSSFSSNAVLELYFFDVNQPGLDMPLNATLPCDSRFHKLIWGCHGMTASEDTDAEYPSGVIVAGCEGGVMQVYDAAKILKNEDATVLTKNKHTGPVRALDFNSFRPHIVASGASDSEIFIWDFNNPKTAMSTGTRSQPADDVTHLAWNKQVEHILASTFSTRCVMWDLRKNEPIIKVADTASRIRYKAVEWHPTVATQMCLASEDDSNPVIQLWDLRYATAPLKVLHGHQRGVLGLSWCKQDEELLLSCGKDSNIMCWNPNYPIPGYELLCEIPTTSQWSFDVSFCPRNPLVISSSSFDGRISIFGLSGGAQQPVTSSKLADSFPGMDMTINQTPVPSQKPLPIQLRDAPKWLKRPCGASFAFGGKLIKFENVKHSQSQPGAADQRIVTISQVVTLPEFLTRSQKLEASLATGNLGEFCEAKANQTVDENESRVWQYLRASFAPNPTYEYLEMLGYNPNDVHAKLGNLVGKHESTDNEVDALTEGFVSLAQGDSFGNQSQPFDNVKGFDGVTQKLSRSTTPGSDQEFEIHTDENPEGLLNQALLSGNIEFAVDLCLQDERWPEAFVLASCGGPELIKRVQLKYFKECKSETSDMIRIIVSQDWKRLVERCNLKYWEQALATILTHVGNENDFTYLAGTLGQRLENSDEDSLRKSAIICYICSGNMDKLADSWTKLKDSGKVAAATNDGANSLQDLVEQVTILKKAAEARGLRGAVTSGPLASKIVEYAMLLASQGSLESALKYLSDSTDPSMISLRERIQYSLGYKYQKPSGIAPRSRQTSESGASTHRGSISLGHKRPSYSSNVPQTHNPYPAVPAPVVANGYGNNFNQQLYNPPTNATNNLPMPPVSSAAHGWNDPPSLTIKPPKSKAIKSTESLEPITHPLFGTGAVPSNTGPPQGGLDHYQSGFPPLGPPGASPYNSFPPTAPPPPASFAPPNPISSSSASTYGAPAVPMFPSGGSTSQNQPPLFTPGPPASAYNPGSVSAFAPRSSLSGPPVSTFTPGPPASLFTPGPPSSNFIPGPPHSGGLNQGSSHSAGFSSGPPPSSGFASGPPPSSGFASGPPPSTGYTAGPPPSAGFTPGPPSAGFTPGPPSSGFTPGPPPSSGFTPGPPPASGFTPGPPPSSGFTPGPPTSTGYTPGLPPSGGYTPGLPPSSGYAPGPPPSTGYTPGPPPSSGFTSGPPSSSTFNSGPSNFTPGIPPASISAVAFPPPPSRTPVSLASGFPGTSVPGLSGESSAATLPPQPLPVGSSTGFSAGQPSEPAASITASSAQSFAPPPPTSGFTPGPSISTPTYIPPPSVSQPLAPLANLAPISSGWDALSTGQPSVQDGVGGPPSSLQTLTPAPVPSSTFSVPQTFASSPPPPLTAAVPVKTAVESEHVGSTGPIPEEHKELVDVLEKLRSECYNVAGLPQIKRKLEDVARKMEILNEKLREKSLSESTLASLISIVDAMKNRDYQLALSIHTMLVTAGNFAEISSFLPSIKVLIQSAAQLNVFL